MNTTKYQPIQSATQRAKKRIIASIKPDPYKAKRESALEYLGESWVLHPNYDSSKHPQHCVVVAR